MNSLSPTFSTYRMNFKYICPKKYRESLLCDDDVSLKILNYFINDIDALKNDENQLDEQYLCNLVPNDA